MGQIPPKVEEVLRVSCLKGIFVQKYIADDLFTLCPYFLPENPTSFLSMHIEKLVPINCILEHIYPIQVTFFINAH